jgi:hypothetical protein
MARRKKNEGGVSDLFIYALIGIGIVLLTATVYMPVLLLIGFAIYSIMASGRMVAEPEADELRQLAAVERELADKSGRLAVIEKEATRADLGVNADGSFDRRSRLGKRLNIEKEELQPRVAELERIASHVRSAPLRHFMGWVRASAVRSALWRTLLIYVVLFVACYLAAAGPLRGLSTLAAQHVLFHAAGVDDAVYGAATLAGIASVVVLLVLYPLQRARILADHADALERWSSFAGFVVEPLTIEGDSEDEDDDEDEEQKWFDVLGVSPNASAAEINSAYKAKMMRNHPDRVAEMDEEFQELAETRAKRLNRARDEGLEGSA